MDETSTFTPASILKERRGEVHDRVHAELRLSNPALLDNDERRRQVTHQVDGVLDDVERCLSGPRGTPERCQSTTGARRRSHGLLPAESLRIDGILFEAALVVLTRDEPDPARVAAIATCLNDAIMQRASRATGAYVTALVEHNWLSQRAERRRLAREMHDRAAHSAGVALQSLELHELFSVHDTERAAAHLVTARQSMLEAVETIRAIATEVRDALAGRDLGEALTAYLDKFAGPRIKTVVHVAGDMSALSPAVAEELYLIVREAVYNTILHADATRLEVRIEVDDAAVLAEVLDDGAGFDPANAMGIGIMSMRERLEALGGRLELTRRPNGGAGVRAVVPLPAR
ncbi:ATP-binding protein [Dactylosporangium sp. NPDC050688]|uniref:sensor histidine kinase n=1 Tax=Dactylosporangium sp. NPDC050688 TaxID=3157217 RepID=UPI0033E78332